MRNRNGFLQPLIMYYLWLALMAAGKLVVRVMERLSVGQSW